MAGGQLF